MKQKISILFLTVLTAFSSCNDNNNNNVNDVVNTVQNGTWRITYFNDSGSDETSHFNGYNFTFGSGNVLTANNGTNTYTGTWSVTSNSNNDDSDDDIDFNISFSSPPDFEELSEDWHFISRSSTKIELVHVSGGNGGTDYLTFEKN